MAIAFSVAGLMLLFWNDLSFSFSIGDGLVVLCAFAFAAQIVMVGMFPSELDPQAHGYPASAGMFWRSSALRSDQRPATACVANRDTWRGSLYRVAGHGAGTRRADVGTAPYFYVACSAHAMHRAGVGAQSPASCFFGEVFAPLAVVGCGAMLFGMVAPDVKVVFRTLSRRRAAQTTPMGVPAR